MWVVVVRFAEEEEEERSVEVALPRGCGRRRGGGSEEVEGGEEVTGDEEGLLGEGEGVEVVEG